MLFVSLREAISIVRTRRFDLTQVSLAQLWFLAFCGAILGGLGAAWDLAERNQVYWAADVNARFKTDNRDRRKADSQPSVRALPYRGQPAWAADHIYWLEKEGERDREKGIVKEFAIGEVTGHFTWPTKPLRMVLRVPDGYALWNRVAFRITSTSGSQLFERLEIDAGRDGTREVGVDVPQCEDGDRVITIVRVGTSASSMPRDLRDVLTVRFE